MSRFPAIVLALACLSTAAGCGASATRHSAIPAAALVADTTRSEASWRSPEEDELVVVETGPAREGARSETATSYRPNREARPTRGAVHAATY